MPWLRVREVWLHLVDLGVGVGTEALPPELAWPLVECPSPAHTGAEPSADGGHGTVVLGSATPRTTVSGPPYALAAWLTGRSGTDDLRGTGEFPQLPRRL